MGVRVDWRADTTSPITNGTRPFSIGNMGGGLEINVYELGIEHGVVGQFMGQNQRRGKDRFLQVEMSRAGVVTRRSPIVSFTATQEFFSRFGNNLAVGQNETYKTIHRPLMPPEL